MLTYTKEDTFTTSTKYVDGVCLSTDTKPTAGIANCSVLIEMNTGKIYMFNEESGEWEEVANGGGGGGGGGFPTATITLVNNDNNSTYWYGHYYMSGSPYSMIITALYDNDGQYEAYTDFPPGTYEMSVILLGSSGYGMFQSINPESTEVTGDAEIIFDDTVGDYVVKVTGDCTITRNLPS